MKLSRFSTWLNESQEEYSKRAMAQRFLQSKGMADNILVDVEQSLKQNRFDTEMVNGADGHTSLYAKTVRWEEDTWHHDFRKRGKPKPNTYTFIITEWAAEPGTVRILWHSLKHQGAEVVVEAEASAIVSKIRSLMYQ